MSRQPTIRSSEKRVRARAERLWREDGAPKGREAEYLDRARALLAIEDNPGAGLLPNPAAAHPGVVPPEEPVEEAAIMENLGEFPGQLTDQGDRRPVPMTRRRAREDR